MIFSVFARAAEPSAAAYGRRAFTLVELLVVVAIVALLAALLLPALARAKESGRTAVCANSARQLALAAMTYSLDFNNRLPPFREWLCRRNGDLTTGRLYPYLGARGGYLCPTDRLELARGRGRTPPGARPAMGSHTAKRDYSYAMNCAICHTTDVSQWRTPAGTVLFLEALLAPNDYSGVAGPGPMASQALAARHHRRGHVLFGDLHLERLRKPEFDRAATGRHFWFPTDEQRGPWR
jgi:prepilin-type N-terminal cleavage/methylation domain-containing protein